MKKLLSIFFIFTITTLPALAATVSGTVLGENNKPLPNANVAYSESGITKGQATDEKGWFELKNIPDDTKLFVSYTGYKKQKISLTANQKIKLELDNIELDEVNVHGCRPDIKNGVKQATYIINGCYPSECVQERWQKEGSGTNAKCVEQKCKFDHGTGNWIQSGENWTCELISCKKGWKKNNEQNPTACIEMLKECTPEQIAQHPNATKTGIEKGTENCIALECECGYDLKNKKCIAWANKTCTAITKPRLPKNAKSADMICENNKAYCQITTCNDGYTLNKTKNTCDNQENTECTHDDQNTTKAKYKKINGKQVCTITDCKDGYTPNKDGTKCVPECKCGQEYDEATNKCVAWPENAQCNATQKPKLPNNATGGIKKCDAKGKAYCEISTCNDGFKVSDDKKSCVSTRGDACDATAIDANATAGVQKKVDDKMTCVITDCAHGFTPNKDGTKCVAGELSEEESQARVDELKDNAQKMKDKEQSTANKLLGAAGIGATGIGGMQMMSAMAEEKSDADAERAMRAYLATFHCEYGGGKNIAGGKTDIELPGGNELINLYSEYVNLANDLKVRKTALDMRPGIESESILDAATSGLYDDVAVGKTTGAYTSLARALMDPTGEDAKKWQEQKQSTAEQKKTGMITAGVGAAGSLIGNLAINSGDSKKNKVDEILDKFEKKKSQTGKTDDETTTECIDGIISLTYYDNSNITISCDEHKTVAHTLNAKEALSISTNWNYNNIKTYNFDDQIEEHEKDACETLKKLTEFMTDKNLCQNTES